MPAAGNMRDRVGFYKRPPQSDDYGNVEGDYPAKPEFVCSAEIKPKLGGEGTLAGRLQGTNLVNIFVYVSPQTRSISTDWMAKNENTQEIYNVRSKVPADARNFRFEILAELGTGSGARVPA